LLGGEMNFLQLKQETHYLLRDTNFLTNNDDQYVDTYIGNWVNEGEIQFCLFTDYGVEQATDISLVASTQEYALPDDFIREKSVIYNCNYLTKGKYANAFLSNITGQPYSYYLRMNYIGFIPLPDSNYTAKLVYFSHGGAMADDTDEPIIPKTYHDTLIHYACMKASLQGDDARYKQFRELWIEKMQIAKQQIFYRENLNSNDYAGGSDVKINEDGGLDYYLIQH